MEVILAQTAPRILERVKGHTGKDVHSYFFFFFERAHEVLNVTNYVIIGKEY